MQTNVRYLAVMFSFSFLGVGCADTNKQPTTKPLSADERQAQILADPMGYGANGQQGKGNGLPDARPTLKGDLDNFFNP